MSGRQTVMTVLMERASRGAAPVSWLIVAALLGAGLAAGLHLALADRPGSLLPAASIVREESANPVPTPQSAPTAQSSTVQSQEIDSSRRTAIVVAADRVGRSVVAISARSTRQANPYAGTVWEDFFPLLRQPRPVQSLGSGFIISRDGTIVTNQHVIEGAEEVRVTLMDGREFAAQVLGADPLTDLAVLRISPGRSVADLPVAPLGSSAGLLIGEWALAIGNPFAPLLADANPSVTVGVISALHRDVRPVPGQAQIWTDMIQTDASINPGNSGGPLVNAAGEVIGVNSFIFSRSGESIGIGFAIPIDRARRIVDDLVRFGQVRLTWLGIHVEDASATDGVGGVDAPRVLIARVDPGSPGENAGVRPGDGLLSANGRRVLTSLDWDGRRLDFRVGDSVELELVRDGEVLRRTITGAADPLAAAPRHEGPLGLGLTPLTPVLRSYLGTSAETGLLVTAVAPGSPAQSIGLEEGDVIMAINGERVRSVDDGVELLRELPNQPRASLVWERRGQLFRWQG
jgi:serine protease Do